MEIKLEQELASVYQYPLVLVLLYIWKAYKNLDRRWLLQNIEGYETGPKLRGLLTEIGWDRK